jgi:hypothetical protein
LTGRTSSRTSTGITVGTASSVTPGLPSTP